MVPSIQGEAAVEKTYADAVKAQPEFTDLSDEAIAAKVDELFTDHSADGQHEWIAKAVQDAAKAKAGARFDPGYYGLQR